MASSSSEPQGTLTECRSKALDLLARRPHFRRQLAQKLLQRGYPEQEVEQVCDYLESRRFLDDLECARSLVSGGLRRKGFGPRRVRAELEKRGAAEEIVDEVLGEAFAGGEEELLRESAVRWLRRSSWNRERLARHLERKGFSGGAILRVVTELEPIESERVGEDVESGSG